MNFNNNNLNNITKRINNNRKRKRNVRRMNRNYIRRFRRRNANNNNIYPNNINFLPRRNFNQYRNSINTNEINTNKIKNLNDKINNLTNDFNKMTLKNTSIPNRFKTNKEMRKDKLISAMNMVKFSSKLGWFKTNLRVVKLDHYMQYNITTNRDVHFFWCPYTYPLCSNVVVRKDSQNAATADQIASLLYMDNNNVLSAFPMDQVKLDGTCRLVSATLKIVNVSPVTVKSGSYTIYQTTNNFVSPYLYYKNYGPIAPEAVALWYQDLIQTSLNTLSTKMVFSATDTGYIDEYNIHEGTNMFNSCKEYMGIEFQSTGVMPIALPYTGNILDKANPIGPNINYIIKIPETNESQNYIIETWAIWEVAPSPESGMSNLASVHNEIFNKNIFDIASNSFPIHK